MCDQVCQAGHVTSDTFTFYIYTRTHTHTHTHTRSILRKPSSCDIGALSGYTTCVCVCVSVYMCNVDVDVTHIGLRLRALQIATTISQTRLYNLANSKSEFATTISQTLNPSSRVQCLSHTRNPEHSTLNPKPHNHHPPQYCKPYTLHPKPYTLTRTPHPNPLNLYPATLKPLNLKTLKPKL